jgi:hypothetical protein
MLSWTEGGLEFDFGAALQTCQPDIAAEPLTRMAPPLKSPDFYVWRQRETLLVEVKDPEGAPSSHRVGAVNRVWETVVSNALLEEHLLPKLYGAYVHLTTAGVEPRGRVRYLILLGISNMTAADRNMLTDKIERVVRRVGPRVRHSRYWPEPEVHNIQSWNLAHPEMRVKRLS